MLCIMHENPADMVRAGTMGMIKMYSFHACMSNRSLLLNSDVRKCLLLDKERLFCIDVSQALTSYHVLVIKALPWIFLRTDLSAPLYDW